MNKADEVIYLKKPGVKTSEKTYDAPQEPMEVSYAEAKPTVNSNAAVSPKPNQNTMTSIDYVRMNELHMKTYGRQVFAVTSTKGGIGKTTIALNMAYLLKERNNAQVCVVDFKQPHGNVAARLLIKSDLSVYDWKKYCDRNISLTDKKIYEELVIKHSGTGLYLLPGVNPGQAITAKLAQYILQHLSQNFDYVIIDVGPEDYEVLAIAASYSNKTYLVVDYDISTIVDTQNYISILKNKELMIEKLNIIINFEPEKKDKNVIDRSTCKEFFLGMNIAGFIPETAGMRTIHNNGKVLAQTDSKAKMVRTLSEILQPYLLDKNPSPFGGFFSFFRRK